MGSRFVDNFANGNVSSGSSLFSGVAIIRNEIKNVLLPKLAQVKTQVERLRSTAGSDLETAINSATSTLNSMKSMPKGGSDLTQFTLTYNTPLV